MGTSSRRDDENATGRAFLAAILRPIELKDADDRFHYDVQFAGDGAERLADAFTRARSAQPAAPLVPELQVVLNHLIEDTTRGTDGLRIVRVPEDPDALDLEIKNALAAHLRRALEEAFPLGRDPAEARKGRSQALLALRELADERGRRGGGLPEKRLADALHRGGVEVIEKLSSASVRLIVQEKQEEGFVYVLAHDRMAEVVTDFVENKRARGELELDDQVVELRRFVGQRCDLYVRSHDPGALRLTRRQYEVILGSDKALLWDKERQGWWEACQKYRRKRRIKIYSVTAVALIAVGLVGLWSLSTRIVTDPVAGVIWTRSDNARDIDWGNADQYCKDWTLAGFGKGKWELPTIEELQKLRDPGSGTFNIRKPFRLTNWWVWSSEKEGSASARVFNFNYGGRDSAPMFFSGSFRALCVRRSGKNDVEYWVIWSLGNLFSEFF
jgi:hypothetical protein